MKTIKIQDIIDNFDKEFICYSMKNYGKEKLIYNELEAVKPLKKFIHSSLTSLLDSLVEEAKTNKKLVETEDCSSEKNYNMCDCKLEHNKGIEEVINIINSHK